MFIGGCVPGLEYTGRTQIDRPYVRMSELPLLAWPGFFFSFICLGKQVFYRFFRPFPVEEILGYLGHDPSRSSCGAPYPGRKEERETKYSAMDTKQYL